MNENPNSTRAWYRDIYIPGMIKDLLSKRGQEVFTQRLYDWILLLTDNIKEIDSLEWTPGKEYFVKTIYRGWNKKCSFTFLYLITLNPNGEWTVSLERERID